MLAVARAEFQDADMAVGAAPGVAELDKSVLDSFGLVIYACDGLAAGYRFKWSFARVAPNPAVALTRASLRIVTRSTR